MICLSSILNCNLAKETSLWIHCSIPQLLVAHLSKTFVTLHLSALTELCDVALTLLLSPAIELLVTLVNAVQWWGSDIYVAILNQLLHLTEEECKHKCRDVSTIDIGIGHNNNLVVTQLLEVQSL